MKTVLVELTTEQAEQLVPLLRGMKDGETCVAQVYIDGMRVRTFDAITSAKIREAIGELSGDGDEGHNSAYDAHHASLKRHERLN